MSRPACYNCQFTNTSRVADISLGDLWGVHIYCPELYGHNGGASVAVCNTEKGIQAFKLAEKDLYGHPLDFETVVKYQSPMRKSIAENNNRDAFMNDLKDSKINYIELNKKWYEKPSFKLLWSKYIWGNRQKVFLWNIKKKFKREVKNND